MSKVKTSFFCQNCGTQHAQWMGKCSNCGEWNTIVEEVISKKDNNSFWKEDKVSLIEPLDKISIKVEPRIETNDKELNRVLGGGIVLGSLVLIGGDPGVGKSTLMLQVAINLSKKTLYVTGEESKRQIKMRADRLAVENSSCHILTETNVQNIFSSTKKLNPELIIIDSIQTLQTSLIDSSPGSISQIRTCASEIMTFAKHTNIPIFLIGHINKDGNIAGPKVLEHMVDVVLQFEGDRNNVYRILRSNKNRFGSTAELGIYEMLSTGLREVENPSEILISQKDSDLSGTAISATIEGLRPLMIEAQALVSSAVYGTPQRSATGFDLRRLSMLLAVLEKRCGFKLGSKECHHRQTKTFGQG